MEVNEIAGQAETILARARSRGHVAQVDPVHHFHLLEVAANAGNESAQTWIRRLANEYQSPEAEAITRQWDRRRPR